MPPSGLTNVGEEFAWKTTYRQDQIGSRPGSISLLLYDDGTDALDDTSDIGDITTEPSTSGSYSRQSALLDSSDVSLSQSGGDIDASVGADFDTTGPTVTVDAWAAVVTFQSTIVNSDSSATDHLLTAATFDGGARDLSNHDTISLNATITLS